MERRSTTRSTPRRKYTVDAFEGIEELQSALSSDDERRPDYDIDAEDSAEEFAAQQNPNSDLEDDDMSGIEAVPEDDGLISDAASDAGERLLDDNISIADDNDNPNTSLPPSTVKQVRFQGFPSLAKTDDQKLRTRGLDDVNIQSTSSPQRLNILLGSSEADGSKATRMRDKWMHEPTLPSRVADSNGNGGMQRSLFVEEGAVEKLMEDEWKVWVDHGGLEAVLGKQQQESITVEEARTYITTDGDGEASFLMGPYNRPKMCTLPAGGSLRLISVWGENEQQRNDYKNGFMLNLGARIHCLDWATNHDGPYHYLAISVLPKRPPPHPPFEAPDAPAFTPQAPHKANIQVWRLTRRFDGCIDTDTSCKLHLMLCTAWGDVKVLKFCPMPIETPTRSDLGLLAGIWGDGAVRVLDLTRRQPVSTHSFFHISTAAFESRPPNTVCTCIAWISSTRIAAGCANGFVAIWDLPASATSTSPNPRPTIYTSISSTYILSITVCYPSRPNLLVTTSMSGYTTVTDLSRAGQPLSSPTNTVSSNRIRVAQPGLAWYEFPQVVLHLEDTYTVKGAPIRRLFTNTSVARARSSVISLATSPCHPFVLIGSASGEVMATNPLNKVLGVRREPAWTQVWFAHEWRRPSDNETGAGEGGESEDGRRTAAAIGPNGLSRVTEGFKIERTTFSNDDRAAHNQVESVAVATVYEEKSAVTALAWNPNPEVGGWAAAGMGIGLLRIENLAS